MPICTSIIVTINPISLGWENFPPSGNWRTTDVLTYHFHCLHLLLSLNTMPCKIICARMILWPDHTAPILRFSLLSSGHMRIRRLLRSCCIPLHLCCDIYTCRIFREHSNIWIIVCRSGKQTICALSSMLTIPMWRARAPVMRLSRRMLERVKERRKFCLTQKFEATRTRRHCWEQRWQLNQS